MPTPGLTSGAFDVVNPLPPPEVRSYTYICIPVVYSIGITLKFANKHEKHSVGGFHSIAY